MAVRENDPQKLQDWMVKTEQRLRMLENRRLEAGNGLSQDHATKTMDARISDDPGNSASIGDDGGIKATDTVTTAADHNPLNITKFMTAGQSIPNVTDTLVSWGGTDTSGTWVNDATSITIPIAGFYMVSFTWQWANNATGVRAAHMTVNSTTVTTGSKFATTVPITTANETAHGFAEVGNFAVNDLLRMYVFQSSGAALSGGGPYFGDIRGRWSLFRLHDAFPPDLTQSTA